MGGKRYTPKQKRQISDHVCGYVAAGDSVYKVWHLLPWPEDVRKPSTYPKLWEILNSDEHAHELREARVRGVEVLVDDQKAIADGLKGPLSDDWTGPPGSLGERAQVARLALDSRRWLAGKIKPRDYGKDVDGDGDKSVTVEVKLDQSGND